MLIIAVGFIILTQVQKYNKEKSIEIYQLGMKEGYNFAVTELIKELATCQSVPVFANNISVNVIAVECLQQPAEI